jgi:hypothetical protein
MRRTFDEIWVLDLGGDNLGARKTPNVFAIQTPVAIAIGIRGPIASPGVPAKTWFAKIEGKTRQDKLKQLDGLADIEGLQWQACSDEWQAPLRPPGKGTYFDWPRVTQLFPYHTAGAVFYRSWPISESEAVLKSRWKKLAGAAGDERKSFFKESRDRKVQYTVRGKNLPGFGQQSVEAIDGNSDVPTPRRYAFRALDRQYAMYDFRLGDFIRPALNYLASDKQTFLIVPDSLVTARGPAALVSSLIPDQHHFRGSFGGRDVIPLYKDAQGKQPNTTKGLIKVLGDQYGSPPTVEDVACYVLAVLGGTSYAETFWNELETPGPRIPLTKDENLFQLGVKIGSKLGWLLTYGERFKSDDRKDIPPGQAKSVKPVPTNPELYPVKYSYNEKTALITVGDGTFGPVEPRVWNYEVSGFRVVQSWLSYRMKKRAGRKSSPLDEIRPERWSPAFTTEFLELLWVVEELVGMDSDIKLFLEKVTAGECFKESELPEPSADDMLVKVPSEEPSGGLLAIMADDAEETEEEEVEEPDEANQDD